MVHILSLLEHRSTARRADAENDDDHHLVCVTEGDIPSHLDFRMPSSPSSRRFLVLFTTFISCGRQTVAKPYPRDVPFAEVKGSSLLRPRSCANPCGWSDLCCTADQQCTTDASGQALCVAGGGSVSGKGAGGDGNGHWEYYTTTWTETDLVTRVSTYSSLLGGAEPTVQAHIPSSTAQSGCSIPCGSICCAEDQQCAHAGQCVAAVAGGFSASYFSSYHAVPTTSPTFYPPLRPTSGIVTTTTSIDGPVTATVPFQTPVGTAGGIVYGTAAATGGGGLSTGAIVGIVIGVLLAIILLIAFFCFAAGRTIFGGRRKRKETTYTRESHHRRHHGGGGGGGGGAFAGRTWYGGRRKRPEPPQRGGKMAPIIAGLGALALALGVKRKVDRRKEGSDYSSRSSDTSYYGYSDTSASMSSL